MNVPETYSLAGLKYWAAEIAAVCGNRPSATLHPGRAATIAFPRPDTTSSPCPFTGRSAPGQNRNMWIKPN